MPPQLDSVSGANAAGKTSQDSGQNISLDRWSQRRLQRLATEQGFREQRQGIHGAGIGGGGGATPTSNINVPAVNNVGMCDLHAGYSTPAIQYANSPDAQPQHQHFQQHQQAQPHPLQQNAFQSPRTVQVARPNFGLAIQTPSVSNPSRPQHYPPDSHSHAQQFNPSESTDFTTQPHEPPRPVLNQTHSFPQHGAADETLSMSSHVSAPAAKATRPGSNNRQSLHNGIMPRDGSQGVQIPGLNAPTQVLGGQSQAYKGATAQQTQQQQAGDVSRGMLLPAAAGDEMTQEEMDQLVKDHKELREKYTKVKKYYFEKEDQVKQLQNSLAHQRLSQSRTSLDDSEYTTRFNRLDGLVAQLAFSIRKTWKSVPQWLLASVNRDAVATGKQEMTASGRAFISCWLVEEVFDKYFHPDLEPTLSTQLKAIQKNIRMYAPVAQTSEEEDYLTAKVVNWRLATLEGLQDTLKSQTCPENRQRLTDSLKNGLVAALALHLQEPPPSDLEGGVHMIIELVVSIAIHLPLESRDVVIDYFMPGHSVVNEQMKVESGIPPLTASIAEDAAERASMRSAASDATDPAENGNDQSTSRKRNMLSALTSAGHKTAKSQNKHSGGSGGSLQRPDSSQGNKDDMPPRIRMAAGIGVQVRGRSVLVKAPVFSI